MTTLKEQTTNSPEVEAALRSLDARTQTINRVYLRHVQNRSLCLADHVQHWVGSRVTLFLRHDRVKAFTVMNADVAAMADYVTLCDVSFVVDEAARLISNRDAGPLPNKRTVHAWLEGQLLTIADDGETPDPLDWVAVSYNPVRGGDFVVTDFGTPIRSASIIRLAPLRNKVWCPRSEVTQ